MALDPTFFGGKIPAGYDAVYEECFNGKLATYSDATCTTGVNMASNAIVI